MEFFFSLKLASRDDPVNAVVMMENIYIVRSVISCKNYRIVVIINLSIPIKR